jgi:hypothetical protein
MPSARTADTPAHDDGAFLIAHDDPLYPGAIEPIAPAALASMMDIPHIDSVKHACNVLQYLLSGPPRTLRCVYQLDGLQFSEMRSSVLRAGIVALAVRAGHHAIVSPISTHLPTAHWRSEFIFRAIRGIRLIKPELSEQEMLDTVTREIHFYPQQASSRHTLPNLDARAALAG